MSELAKSIAHIEAVTGQEYGEWPRDLKAKEFYKAYKEHHLRNAQGVWRAMKTLSWHYNIVIEPINTVAGYSPEIHSIIVDRKQELADIYHVHETMHGFQRNHWPELFDKTKLGKLIVLEGMADYVAMRIDNAKQVEYLKNKRGRLKQRDVVDYFLGGCPHLPYRIGRAVVEASVAETGDVWTGLDALARNPPEGISDALKRIEVQE